MMGLSGYFDGKSAIATCACLNWMCNQVQFLLG